MAKHVKSKKVVPEHLPAVTKLKNLCGGTQRQMAEKFGVTQYCVMCWLRTGVPIKRKKEIESLFGDKITKEELWPEYYN